MFFCEYSWHDPFNKENKRNIGNSDKWKYNCGGYALGTFSWYCPYHSQQENDEYFDWDNDKTDEERLKLCVTTMLEDFPNLLVITKEEIHKYRNYEIIAFKVCETDFHYIVKKAIVGLKKWGVALV